MDFLQVFPITWFPMVFLKVFPIKMVIPILPSLCFRPSSNSQVLGLQPGASSAAVRRAYHCLALLHHPDKGGGWGMPHWKSWFWIGKSFLSMAARLFCWWIIRIYPEEVGFGCRNGILPSEMGGDDCFLGILTLMGCQWDLTNQNGRLNLKNQIWPRLNVQKMRKTHGFLRK